MKFKAAIFDLDGTLIDSMSAWENIGSEFLKRKGKIPPENLSEILKSMSFVESSKYFIDKFDLNLSVEEVISEFNAMVEDKYKYDIDLKSHVVEYLEKLKSKNIKICVVTATDKKLTKIALTRLKVLGYAPNEIMVFEDALHCIKAAKNSGFYVVGVYDESIEEDKKEKKKLSDIYIESLETLA